MSLPAIARLLPLCLMLSACGTSPRTSAPAAPALAPDYPQGQALFHGTLTRQGSELLFHQCGNPDAWQFQADETFRRQWQRLGNPPQVYAELEGELVLGEARGAPFRLRPGRLNLLTTSEGDACQRDPGGYAWRAFGTDPDWRLGLQGAQARLTTPAAPRTAYQLLTQRRQPDGGVSLRLRDAAGQPAQLRLTPEPCTDSRPDTLWGYRVSLRSARQTLSGCGERGRPLLTLQPQQHWQGLVPHPDSRVALTLQANYQASLTYVPTRGPQVLYEGVWQPTREGLGLLFNRRLGRGVREGIPFRQLGSRLSADYRLLNGGQVDFEPPLQLQPGAPGLPTATVMAPKAAAVTDLRASSLQAASQPDAAIIAALQAWRSIGSDTASRLQYRYLKYDLNEDGREDALVQLGGCGPSGCDWLILEGQAGGYRPLGTMTGFQGPLLVAPERQHGWHALLVQPQFERWVSLPFDGSRYPSNAERARTVPTPDSHSHVQLLFNTGDWLSLN